jgi:hypothetical protein
MFSVAAVAAIRHSTKWTFCFSVAIQGVQVNRRINFDTRARNQPAERRGNISTRMPVERLQHK